MTQSANPARPQSKRMPLAAGEAGHARLRLYGLCLAGSLVCFAAFHLFSEGLAAAVPAAALIAVVLAACAGAPGAATPQRLFLASACLSGVLVIAVPLGAEVGGGLSVPDAVRQTTVWPQILALLFASRITSELCDLRFAEFWRMPLASGRHPRTQSMLAAAMLGAGLTLVFYQFSGGTVVDPGRLDPIAIIWRALTGETVIHVAIILLFFVLAAAILDAVFLCFNDDAVLGALRRLCKERVAGGASLARADVRALADTRLAEFGHSRTVQFVREAVCAGGAATRDRQGGRAPLETFHAASRRMIRALLSFLPLLGFLGTVIGLTAAIGSLPTEIGPGASGNGDISGSLAGLAVKFETTLLGLSGGLLASLLLALVERRESELAGECARLVEAAAHDG